MNRNLTAAAIVVACAWTRAAAAQDAAASEAANQRGGPRCGGLLDPDAVVRCALAASPELREARAQLAAAAGRRTTAGVWLPSNPTVSGALARRRRPPPPEEITVLNWVVSLSQELEIAGQRGARIDAADAEVAAFGRRVAVAEQEVAAGALAAYYEAVAAGEGLRVATTLAETAGAVASTAEGRAREAVLAGVEADVARAEATRIGLGRFEAQRRLADARATLAVLLDARVDDLQLPVDLPPTPATLPGGSLEDQALRLRGEVGAAEMERRVLERRLALVRRGRVPNPTISVFAERGEIDDHIFGFGLSFPLPLPSPVGRTRAGEIAETLAQIQVAESAQALVRRRVRLEVARAQAAFAAREGAAALFTGDLLARARADLAGLRDAISSRQLSFREALQWQRALMELLQADIGVRLGRALAWVDLRRVVGLPLTTTQGGGR